MERRSDWDFVKASLMLIVIFGHVCPANPDTWTPITRIIGLFVMPLFFFVSGFFQTYITNVGNLYDKLKKTCFRILLPQLSWGCIYVIFSLFVLFPVVLVRDIGSYIVTIMNFLKFTPYYIAGFYWFLTALIMCILFGSLISLFYSYSHRFGIIAMFASPIFFCMLPIDPYHFSFVWLFYIVGMNYKKCEKFVHLFNETALIIFVVLFLTIAVIYCGLQFYPDKTFYYSSNLFIETPIINIVYRYGLCLIASLLTLYWLMKIYIINSGAKLVAWIASSGRNTLFIYCSHMIILEFIYNPILWNIYNREDFPSNPNILFYLFGGIVSILLYYFLNLLCIFLKKYKICRFLLMGS